MTTNPLSLWNVEHDEGSETIKIGLLIGYPSLANKISQMPSLWLNIGLFFLLYYYCNTILAC